MSEQAKHTPGPWRAFDHYCGRDPKIAGEYASTRLIGVGQFDTIAEVRHGHDELEGDVDANARLIAAAPDLLEAATSAFYREVGINVAHDTERNGWEWPETAPQNVSLVAERLRAAIAKALGQDGESA